MEWLRVPSVKYTGYKPICSTPAGYFERNIPVVFSQEKLDAHRRKLTGPDFEILDDANTPSPEASVSVDEGPVGDPDMGWVRRDIIEWLAGNDINVRAGLTKAQLLTQVEEHLNPTEESIDEAPSPEPEEESESDE